MLIPLLRILAIAGGTRRVVERQTEANAGNSGGIFYKDVSIMCDLRLPDSDRRGDAPADIVLVNVRIAMDVRCARGTSNRPVSVAFAIPTMPGRLLKSGLSHEVGLRSLIIDGVFQSPEQLHLVTERMRSNLQAVSKDQLAELRFDIELQPGAARRVSIEYVLAKKQFDLEVFAWRYPVKGLRLTAFDQTGLNLALHANALASPAIEQTASADAGHMQNWELLDDLAAGEGFVFWWELNQAPALPPSERRPRRPLASRPRGS